MNEDHGYYVSKEMATGFITNQKKLCCYLGIGAMFLILAGIPYTLFQDNLVWRYLGMAICIFIGIISFVIGMFSEREEYNILKQEPLLFDSTYLKELTYEYHSKKKKYVMIAIPCTVLFVGGLLVLAFTKRGYLVLVEYHAFVFLALAIGILGFMYTLGAIETYELLVKNDAYSKGFFFKVRRNLRKKIQKMN